MLLDTTKDIHVDYEHVILDGVSRDRFPAAFLVHHAPKGFQWQDYSNSNGRKGKLSLLVSARRLSRIYNAPAVSRIAKRTQRPLEKSELDGISRLQSRNIIRRTTR